MPNGDIVTGCSDAIVRIFSADESRQLPSEELKAYDEQVASQALPAQQVGDVKKSDLPGLEALSTPGMLDPIGPWPIVTTSLCAQARSLVRSK